MDGLMDRIKCRGRDAWRHHLQHLVRLPQVLPVLAHQLALRISLAGAVWQDANPALQRLEGLLNHAFLQRRCTRTLFHTRSQGFLCRRGLKRGAPQQMLEILPPLACNSSNNSNQLEQKQKRSKRERGGEREGGGGEREREGEVES
jgi:hypothetical protein